MGISLMVLCVITVMVFHSDQAMTGPNYPLGFLMLSILIWIAVRLGSRATVTGHPPLRRNSDLGNVAGVWSLRPRRSE